MCIFNNIKQR